MPNTFKDAISKNHHRNFFKYLLFLLTLAMATRGDPAVIKQVSNLDSDLNLELPLEIIYSSCGVEGDFETCFAQICMDVGESIIPLNLGIHGGYIIAGQTEGTVEAMGSL